MQIKPLMIPFSKKTLSNQKGFTFIEAILTSVLLSMGLMGGFAMMENATAHSLNNDFLVMGSQLANEKIEEIIADKTFQGYSVVTDAVYPDESLLAPYSGFSRSVSVQEVSSTDLTTPEAGSGYKRVDVTVSWGSAPGEQVEVSTMLSNYGS